MPIPRLLPLLIWLSASAWVAAQQEVHLKLESPYGSFVEDGFPYFTQTLDARKFGPESIPTNLTPRGIIVKAGNGIYGCFDPDLLRWSLFWKENEKGEYLTMDGMAPGSYRLPNRKSSSGQKSLPRPLGTAIAAAPAVPGWSLQEKERYEDPRPQKGADPQEIGLGPVPLSLGRFQGIRLTKDGVQLEYKVGSLLIAERVEADRGKVVRHISFAFASETLTLLVPSKGGVKSMQVSTAGKEEKRFSVSPDYEIVLHPAQDHSVSPPKRIWKESITVSQEDTEQKSSSPHLIYDDLPLPLPNPWKRNVRLSGIDFFPDGKAVLCTFDGDVWIVEGVEEGNEPLAWSRYASGLHEPKSVQIVDGEIFVFDRNGIVRLDDLDQNGEADWYANFSNIVPQTAETREFAMDMVSDRKGGFFLAKGGQVGSTKGVANGTIAHVDPSGDSYSLIATGLRQPYIGFDPDSGILTSSDQQGHWKPATPIYRIEKGKYYGFQPAKLKDKAVHPAPIASPEIWIPHFINPSGASQIWAKKKDSSPANMGALNGELLHLGYNRPELFRIYLDENRKQGAVLPLLSGFPSGILKGAIHPKDGRLYVSGFEIWGSLGTRVSGLYRIRPLAEETWMPNRILASQRGVLLSFNQAVSPDLAKEVGRYSVERWNYQQTHNYGSGNFRLDGKPGQESVPVSDVRISQDQKSVFIAIPDMKPCHSLRVTYRLPVQDSAQVESAYLTAIGLETINLTSIGFESNEVNLEPHDAIAGGITEIEPTAKLGKEIATRYGCIACHATGEKQEDATTTSPPLQSAAGAQIAVGPAWKGLWGSRRDFTDGSFLKSADEPYLRESILDPGRRVAKGYETEKTGVGMPSYLGVLKTHEIDSILLYIQTLK